MDSFDWTAPPEPKEWTDLWDLFHDSAIHSVRSDRSAGTVELDIELGFPRPSFPHPSRVEVRIEQVRFVLAYAWRDWPATFQYVPNDEALKKAHFEMARQRARIETISISEIGELVESGEGGDVAQASFAEESGMFWLSLHSVAMLDYSSWEIRIFGASVRIQTDEGATITLAELLDIGGRAWQAWQAKPQ